MRTATAATAAASLAGVKLAYLILTMAGEATL